MKTPVLVVGHVTKDVIDGKVSLGGSAAYIAQALSFCGQDVALVTRALKDDHLLEPLLYNSRIDLHLLASDTITTFNHKFEAGTRQLSLDACAADITANDIPLKWRNLPLVFLVPVSGECSLDLLSAFPESELVIGMQGWLRIVGANGQIKPSSPPDALLKARLLAVTLSADDHPEAGVFAKNMAEHCRLVAITKGEQAITIYEKFGHSAIPVTPVQHVHDTNGAGDIFTALLGLQLMAGHQVKIAVTQAAKGTALYVEKGMAGLNEIQPINESSSPSVIAKKRIRKLVARSEVPEDPGHADNTLEWLLRLEPNSNEALQIAAIAHDIDRATPERIKRDDHPDYDAFKAAHARRGARLLRGILEDCMIDSKVIQEACRLVEIHEVGGDPRSDLLKDADSISYFDVNMPLYFQRHGWDETKRRSRWGYRRLTTRAQEIVKHIDHEDKELLRLLQEVIHESIS